MFLVLAEDAIRAALLDYKVKNNTDGGSDGEGEKMAASN